MRLFENATRQAQLALLVKAIKIPKGVTLRCYLTKRANAGCFKFAIYF
jgi:hypothetical protein